MDMRRIEPEVSEQMNIETGRHFIGCSNVYFTDRLGSSLNLTK